MAPESKEIVSPTAPLEPKPSQITTPPSAPGCPWANYLTGKKTSPERFLATMAKGAITIPDDETKKCFAEALAAKPDRLARLILLMQAPVASDTIRRIVTDFAETAIRRLDVVSLSDPLDATAFLQTVSSWLDGIRKKPLKPAELNILFLLLHFGWRRELLDHDAAFLLVASAVSKSAKPSRKPPRTAPAKTPLEVLLAATPVKPVLASLVAHFQAWQTKTEDSNRRIDQQDENIALLGAECARLQTTMAGLESEIGTLKEQKATAETKNEELERQTVQIHDGYQHKLDELRGRIRGVLKGQLTRWLQTALDAARSDPPFTTAMVERLEDALKLIEKEIQWLQPSG